MIILNKKLLITIILLTIIYIISINKDANFINVCGEQLQELYNINYLYADFKKENGYLNSINESKKLELYRQDYCGCEFSFKQKTD